MENRADVIDRERAFHNERFAQSVDPRSHLDKWYVAIQKGAIRQDSLVRQLATDADVLEYGCSDGGLSIRGLKLPSIARSLRGIDISDVAIEKANRSAEDNGYSNSTFYAMNAEQMSFAPQSFDLVFGRGIIHHLDLDKCYSEIHRVLRYGGKAVFYEPMGHNPILNMYRNRTPALRTVDEHPLLLSDFDKARSYFSEVEVEYFGLASVASALMPTRFAEPMRHFGEMIDNILLKVPGVQKFAWYANITLTK